MGEDHSAFTILNSDEERSSTETSSRSTIYVLSIFLRPYLWLRFLVTFDLSKVTKESEAISSEV
jgi:hypothetical protein